MTEMKIVVSENICPSLARALFDKLGWVYEEHDDILDADVNELALFIKDCIEENIRVSAEKIRDFVDEGGTVQGYIDKEFIYKNYQEQN